MTRQMLLFTDLPTPPAPPQSPQAVKVARPWRVAVQVLAGLLQLPIRAPLRALERDDVADDDAVPVHRVVKANEVPPVETRAFPSIFGMADAAKAAKALQRRGRFGQAQEERQLPPLLISREFGRVKVVRLQPAETEEWQAKEQARRARQRPPKPVKKAKTRSKKLLEMIGEGTRDD